MQSKLWGEALLVVAFLLATTAVIAATGADMAIASHFYVAGGWPVGEQFPWNLLYQIDRYPGAVLGIIGLCAACSGSLKPGWRNWRRQGLFLVLLLALGPGLMVNMVFKDHWGRPRPREVVQLGGTEPFLQPWQPGINGQGRSFPSGHASAAFYLSAPFFIYRRSKKRLARRWLVGGVVFGLLMGYARLAQGGHFLSDIIWAWGIVYLTGLLLAAVLLERRDAGTEFNLQTGYQGGRGKLCWLKANG
ncbi:MAG: phosphatase PAP2 family protein [Desulfuromonadaceae bacterium]|nr:phosphatase PAP2 family protein [Desulfuromonadaceae bacterium]